MVARQANLLSFEDAKKASEFLIDNIYEFVDSVDKLSPGQGYDQLAIHLITMKNTIVNSTSVFMTNETCDNFIHEFLFTLTNIHPDIQQNLQDFNDAYTEIGNFFATNSSAGNFQLTNYGDERIIQMIKINHASNDVLIAMKNDPCNLINLHASFAIHSSKTEMSEFGLLNELKGYEKIMKNNSITPNFDPVQIFSINNKIDQKDGSYITEARALRNLVDHHKYDLDMKSTPCVIHFKSTAGSGWNICKKILSFYR